MTKPTTLVAAALVVAGVALGACAGASSGARPTGSAVAGANGPSEAPPAAPTSPSGPAPTAPTGVAAAPSSTARAAPSPATPSSVSAPTTAPTPTSPPPSPAACPTSLATRLASTGTATELITVDAPSYGTVTATLALWRKAGGCWLPAGGPWPALLGAAGFSDHHREGDLTTPTGAYGIGPVMYGNAADPGVRYAYHRLVCGDWWDEDPTSAAYNTFQHVACGHAPPFGGGSEALWQEVAPYPSFAVIAYNSSPVVTGAGSAIFLHASTGGSTAGCVSIAVSDLDTTLRWLDPAADPLIVMAPDSEISRL